MSEDYCRSVCRERCAECPAPPLLPESVPAIVAYQVCKTQWRAGMGGRTGLDYTACNVALDAHRTNLGLPPNAELWDGLQIIERALLNTDAELIERDRARKKSGADHGHA